MESSAGSAGEAAPLPSLALGLSALSGCAKLSQGGAQVGHCVKQATSGAAFQHKFGLFLEYFFIYILKMILNVVFCDVIHYVFTLLIMLQ